MKSYVDAKTLKKDTLALGKRVGAAADGAVKVAISQSQAFCMQFDETESVPFVKDANGRITVYGPGLEKAAEGEVASVLAQQTKITADTLQRVLQQNLKEALE